MPESVGRKRRVGHENGACSICTRLLDHFEIQSVERMLLAVVSAAVPRKLPILAVRMFHCICLLGYLRRQLQVRLGADACFLLDNIQTADVTGALLGSVICIKVEIVVIAVLLDLGVLRDVDLLI